MVFKWEPRDAWIALDMYYYHKSFLSSRKAPYKVTVRILHSDAVPDFKGRYNKPELTEKQVKSETNRLRRLVTYWELNTDIPKLGQFCTTRASPRARNGFAGRVWSCDVPKVLVELDRDPSLYLCELSEKVLFSTGRRYSKKSLMACLWSNGYSLKALTHRARCADNLRRAEFLLMMKQFLPNQLVFVDET